MRALCLPAAFLGLHAAWLRVRFPAFHFFLSLFLLCVHRTEPHKPTRTVSTRGHVLFTGVLCVACLLCSLRFAFLSCLFSVVLAFLLLLLQVEQPGIQDANE